MVVLKAPKTTTLTEIAQSSVLTFLPRYQNNKHTCFEDICLCVHGLLNAVPAIVEALSLLGLSNRYDKNILLSICRADLSKYMWRIVHKSLSLATVVFRGCRVSH